MFMINPKENLIGKNFGRLTVKELSNNKTASRGRIWVCECECGNIKEISQNALITGATISCGCYNKERIRQQNFIDLTGKTFKNGWYTEERLNITKQRDREKNEYCWAHNIPIIRIPYWIYDTLSIDDLKLETSNYIVQYKINGGNECKY